MIELTEKQRIAILNRVAVTVAKKFYDPMLNGVEWESLVETKREQIIRARSVEEFEKEINELLKTLRTSHVGFFHRSVPRGSSRQAIAATFCKAETAHGTRWVFQDVHSEGPAHLAGSAPRDVLLKVGDRDVLPPESPWFTMGSASSRDRRQSERRYRYPHSLRPDAENSEATRRGSPNCLFPPTGGRHRLDEGRHVP